MKPKQSRNLLLASACLLAFLNGLVLLYVFTGWAPVLGNLISAAQLRSYTAQVYPELVPGHYWAAYDLKNGGYGLDFSLKNGGGHRYLTYDSRSGTVQDERRETVLRMRLGIAKSPEVNGNMASWGAQWSPRDPETPLVSLGIRLRDKTDVPVPDEAAMREIMADRAMELYAALSPRTPVHTISVQYGHDAVQKNEYETLHYLITVELPEDTPLTREMILSGKLKTR